MKNWNKILTIDASDTYERRTGEDKTEPETFYILKDTEQTRLRVYNSEGVSGHLKGAMLFRSYRGADHAREMLKDRDHYCVVKYIK